MIFAFDKIWNEEICLKIGVASIEEKAMESYLRWLGCVEESDKCASEEEWFDSSQLNKRR